MNEDELFFEDDFESVAGNSEENHDQFEEQRISVDHPPLPLQNTNERPILASQEAPNFVWYESSALSNRSNRNTVTTANRNSLENEEKGPPQTKKNNINPVNLFKINSRKDFLNLVLQVASRDVKMCLAGVNITHPDIFYTTKQLLEEKREEFIQKQKDKAVHQKHQKQLKEFAQKQQHQLQQMELEAKHRELELKQRDLEQKQREWEERLDASVATASKKEAAIHNFPKQEEKAPVAQSVKQETAPIIEKKMQSNKHTETKKVQSKLASQTVQQPNQATKTTPRQVHFSDTHVEEFFHAAINEKAKKQESEESKQQDSQIAFYKPKAKKTSTRKISDLEKKLRLQEELQKKLKTRLDNLQLETKTQPIIETPILKKGEEVTAKNVVQEQSIAKQLLPEDRELLDLSKLLHGVEKDIKVDNMLHMLEKYEAKDKEIAQRYSGKNLYRVSMSYSDISSSTSSSVANSHVFENVNEYPLVYDEEVLQQIYGYKDAFQKFLDQTDYAILRKSSDLPPNAVSDLLCEYIIEEVLMECAKEIQSIGNATVQAIFDAEFTIRNSLSVSRSIPEEVFEAAKIAQ